MQKTKEKCCADCKHCIKHTFSSYECQKTGKRNRITGVYEFKVCEKVIDTSACEFEDITTQRLVIQIITIVLGVIAAFYVGGTR